MVPPDEVAIPCSCLFILEQKRGFLEGKGRKDSWTGNCYGRDTFHHNMSHAVNKVLNSVRTKRSALQEKEAKSPESPYCCCASPQGASEGECAELAEECCHRSTAFSIYHPSKIKHKHNTQIKHRHDAYPRVFAPVVKTSEH